MAELEVRNLSKRYGRTVAVDDLSFAVEPGRVTGFLGPNGAGKTTTMRALLGLIAPSEGEALVEGRPLREMRDPLRTIGVALELGIAIHELAPLRSSLEERFLELTGEEPPL
ncbi:MAG: ATP-binding cassette domain-containing protein [Solirubrobacterales bacterium]